MTLLQLLIMILGIVLTAGLIPWVLWVSSILRNIDSNVSHLKELHDNPENTGFGTIGMKEVIEKCTTAIQLLIHYVKWSSEQASGKEPPPPLE